MKLQMPLPRRHTSTITRTIAASRGPISRPTTTTQHPFNEINHQAPIKVVRPKPRRVSDRGVVIPGAPTGNNARHIAIRRKSYDSRFKRRATLIRQIEHTEQVATDMMASGQLRSGQMLRDINNASPGSAFTIVAEADLTRSKLDDLSSFAADVLNDDSQQRVVASAAMFKKIVAGMVRPMSITIDKVPVRETPISLDTIIAMFDELRLDNLNDIVNGMKELSHVDKERPVASSTVKMPPNSAFRRVMRKRRVRSPSPLPHPPRIYCGRSPSPSSLNAHKRRRFLDADVDKEALALPPFWTSGS